MERDKRRLAAIVSADVVGYSRLMGRDESGTLATLKAHRRELIDPKIAEYGGRIVKTTGDGVLLEFPSVVDAVRCSVDIQRGMAERNSALPQDGRMEFRFGINVGDIIIDGDDIYGDGVNVAARLEALAEPGGIFVSRVVRDQVLDKLSFSFESVGARQVKNIARPVEMYRVRETTSDGIQARSRVPAPPKPQSTKRNRQVMAAALMMLLGLLAGSALYFWRLKPAPDDLSEALMSVAVLPFTSNSPGVENDEYADRLTKDLTSAIERGMRNARVVSPGLAAKFKRGSTDPRSVGHDLNVRYLIEGEVGHEGGARVLTSRMLETGSGAQIWSTRLQADSDGERGDRLVAGLANQLRPVLYGAEEKRVSALPAASANVLELVLQADQLAEKKETRPRAEEMYREALRRNPNVLPALIGLHYIRQTELLEGGDRDRLVREMDDLSQRAVRVARDDVRAWMIRFEVLIWQWQWQAALEAADEAVRIDPYRNSVLSGRAYLLIVTGRPEEALPLLDKAIALNPRGGGVPEYLHHKCFAFMHLARYDEAADACERAIALAPEFWFVHLRLTAVYANKGDMVRANASKAALLKQQPTISIARLKGLKASDNPTFLQQRETHLFAGLRKAGIPEG